MYLQITTKCNMRCAHCCYSCNKNGKHGDYSTIIDAIAFAKEYGNETITIGGGEPTLHPRFFDILGICLQDFDYVWMATNGSKTRTMRRLANIIDGCDYESFNRKDYCTCDKDDDGYECYCEPKGLIYQEDKLSVALSQDCFHDPINPAIVRIWTERSQRRGYLGDSVSCHYEIRDVSRSVAAQGRAKRTGSGWGEHCVCSDFIIRPDGQIKMCGCTGAPIIGDVWNGIDHDRWDRILNSSRFLDSNCSQKIHRKRAA